MDALVSYTHISTSALLADSKDGMCVADISAGFVVYMQHSHPQQIAIILGSVVFTICNTFTTKAASACNITISLSMMHQLWKKELFLSNPRAGNHKGMLNVAHAQQVELPGITENVAVNRATGCFTAYHTNTKVIIKEGSKQTAAKVYVATKIAKFIT